MKTLSDYPKSIYIGTNNGEKIYLSAPSWDCGWYWGFGYLGNKNCHYHVDGLTKHEKYDFDAKCFRYEFTNLYDGFKKHFADDLVVRGSQLWTLVELFKTFYALKEAAEVLGRGGAHYTTNPAKDVIINKDEVDRINNVVMPQIFEEIYKILVNAQNNAKQDKKILSLLLDGDTSKITAYMRKNGITTDDLKDIKGVSKDDFSAVHSMYWKEHHATNKVVTA